jgi:aspartate racemase
MKHLGILAHSAEGAALCFTTFCRAGGEMLGSYEHPDVTLDCISFARCLPAYERGDYDAARDVMMASLGRLADAGADFFVCPDNTVHLALERPGPEFPLPGLHIGEVVAEQAARDGRERVGVLGTRYTMEGPVYPRALGRHGIEAEVPSETQRARLDEIIFRELVHGVTTEGSRRYCLEVIASLADRGCDAVALVCTEIPLIVTPDVSPLPTLDSTRLLARRALHAAVDPDVRPTWLGGSPEQ